MLNEKELQIFVEYYECAFFVGELESQKVLYSNQKARDMYGTVVSFPELAGIFFESQGKIQEIERNFVQDLEERDTAHYYNVKTMTASGEVRIVDVHAGFYNQDFKRFYIELLPKTTDPVHSLKTIVNDLRKPTLVANTDGELSLFYGNSACFEAFGLHEGDSFADLFPPLRRQELLHQILTTLEKEKSCYIKLELLNKEGEMCWFALDVQGHKLGGLGDKLIIVANCIEEQIETQEKLQEINSYFNIIQTLTKGLLYRLDVEKRILFRNEETAKQYGIPSMVADYPNREQLEGVFHPADIEGYITYMQGVLKGEEGTHLARMAAPSGNFEYHEITFKQLLNSAGVLKEMVGTAINVNDMKETEDKLAVVNQYFNIIQGLSTDLLYRFDIHNRILYRNEQTAQFYHIESVVKNYPQEEQLEGVFHPDDMDGYMSFIGSVIRGMEGTHTARMRAPSGKFEFHKIHFKKVLNQDGTIKEMIGKAVNIQDLMELETKASYDMLTGVLNKISFQEQITHILSHSSVQNRHALFFIDLDGFKGVNDNLGHSFGDYLLKTMGDRLKSMVRGHDLIGRVGGDEFVIFLDSCGDNLQLQDRADRILNTLRQEYKQGEIAAKSCGSIGVAVFPIHGGDYETLYENADKALYESKKRGKDVATIYSPDLEG